MPGPEFRPLTAREALLSIRIETGAATTTPPGRLLVNIAEFAEEGLNCWGMENFEQSDRLADSLAEAHGVLREIRNLIKDDTIESNPLTVRHPMLDVEIDGVLALPPDQEAMINRRIQTQQKSDRIVISLSREGAASFVSDSSGWGAIGLQEVTEAIMAAFGGKPPKTPEGV